MFWIKARLTKILGLQINFTEQEWSSMKKGNVFTDACVCVVWHDQQVLNVQEAKRRDKETGRRMVVIAPKC